MENNLLAGAPIDFIVLRCRFRGYILIDALPKDSLGQGKVPQRKM